MPPKQFPDNVVPQFRSIRPGEPLPCLSCPPDTELQAIVFDNTNLSIIKGWEWRANVDLKNFFQPVNNYAENQVVVEEDDTITLSYGPIADADGNVDFLVVFPQYHQTNIELQSDWKMKWRFVGSTAWSGLGRILMLSGTEDYKIGPIEIENVAPSDIELKILISR